MNPDYFHDRKLHWDHFIPQSKGGQDELLNLVQSCQSCNLAKADKTPEEWAAFCHNEVLNSLDRLTWLIGPETVRAVAAHIDSTLEGIGHYCDCGTWHLFVTDIGDHNA